ncbi:hypothetical protein J6P04_02715 [bacterium]|nr:hypothetical protein [bacterium]
MTPTSSTKYRLYATNTKNNNYSLGSNTIIINPVTEILTIDSVANTNDYDYGANCTLQINHAKSNYGNNTIASYQ